MSTRGTLLFASSYPASFFFPKFSIVRFIGLLFSCRCSAIFLVARATRSRHCRYSCPVQRYWLNKPCTAAAYMHACKHSSLLRRTNVGLSLALWLVREFGSVHRGWLFFIFGVWICRIEPIFSLPQLAFDLTSTPMTPDSSRHRSSISLPAAPGTMSSILFAKRVIFEHSVSSPRPVITSRREENLNQAKVFKHPIDSQSPSSCLISPHLRPVLSQPAAVQRVS